MLFILYETCTRPFIYKLITYETGSIFWNKETVTIEVKILFIFLSTTIYNLQLIIIIGMFLFIFVFKFRLQLLIYILSIFIHSFLFFSIFVLHCCKSSLFSWLWSKISKFSANFTHQLIGCVLFEILSINVYNYMYLPKQSYAHVSIL